MRDSQKLVDRRGQSAQIAQRAKDIGKYVFRVWKDFKAGGTGREALKRCLRPPRDELKALLTDGLEVQHPKTVRFRENLLALEPAIWTFTGCDGLAPTNDHGERLLRRGVPRHKGSFGTWSDSGSRLVERILPLVQTCRLQKLPAFKFLVEAVTAQRAGKPAPSLLHCMPGSACGDH